MYPAVLTRWAICPCRGDDSPRFFSITRYGGFRAAARREESSLNLEFRGCHIAVHVVCRRKNVKHWRIRDYALEKKKKRNRERERERKRPNGTRRLCNELSGNERSDVEVRLICYFLFSSDASSFSCRVSCSSRIRRKCTRTYKRELFGRKIR